MMTSCLLLIKSVVIVLISKSNLGVNIALDLSLYGTIQSKE